MSDGLSNFDKKQGWRSGAALHCFKTFSFSSKDESKQFLLDLIQIKIPSEIHMQVTPNHFNFDVIVRLAYESIVENDVKILLLKIEEKYTNFII